MNTNPQEPTDHNEVAVLLTVLKLMLEEFVRWGLQAALVYDYPDLKEYAHFEDLQTEDISLFLCADNARSQLLLEYANQFNSMVMDYMSLFAPLLKEIVVEEETAVEARYFYNCIIYETDSTKVDLDVDLELFAYSVMHLLYCLCEFVILGETAPEDAFEEGGSYYKVMDGDWDEYLEYEHYEYNLVAMLMGVAIDFYEELTDFLLDAE